MSTYYVTRCGGRQLGGPWGQTRRTSLFGTEALCMRCHRLAEADLAGGISGAHLAADFVAAGLNPADVMRAVAERAVRS